MAVRHEVRAGDSMASIAHAYGWHDWQGLWEHSDNAELRRRRASPHVLYPGDVVMVPDSRPRPSEVEAATGQRHRFVVRAATMRLKLALKDRSGAPVASRAFEVRVGGRTVTGTTDGTGRVDVALPPDAHDAELRVTLDGGRTLTVPLAIGYLDPIEEESGVKQRLRNLGYLPQAAPSPAAVAAALEAFQEDQSLQVTGEADEVTRARLRERHKS